MQAFCINYIFFALFLQYQFRNFRLFSIIHNFLYWFLCIFYNLHDSFINLTVIFQISIRPAMLFPPPSLLPSSIPSPLRSNSSLIFLCYFCATHIVICIIFSHNCINYFSSLAQNTLTFPLFPPTIKIIFILVSYLGRNSMIRRFITLQRI